MKMRHDIQFLRGLALITVVFFHLKVPFFENGFLGVDVFFVISGFLMAKLYDRSSVQEFYWRRFTRLYLPYMATISIAIFFAAFVTVPVDFRQFTEQVVASLFFTSNLFFWNQNSYFDKAAFNPLLNLWSLSVEVQFYIIVPFLYAILRKSKKFFILVFLLSFIFCVIIQTISSKTSFFLMPFRIWEFLAGAWVAWWGAHVDDDSERNNKFTPIFFLICLVYSLFAIKIVPDATDSIIHGHPALPALIVTVLTAVVINYGIHPGLLRSLIGKSLIKIGDLSYSIYLTHFPIIVLLNYMPFEGTRLGFDGWMHLTFLICTIIITSLIIYIFIENNRFSIMGRRFLVLPLFFCVLILTFVLELTNIKKYADPYPNIFSAWTDRDKYRCGKFFRIIYPGELVCPVDLVEADRRILLVGNSHADSIKKVFSGIARNHGYITYFTVANDPLIGLGPNAEMLISESIKLNIAAIVLHYSDVFNNSKALAEIHKLIKLANKNNINISLIGPVPTYDVHIPKVVFYSLNGGELPKLTREGHLLKMKNFQLFSAGINNEEINIFDPSEILCASDGYCTFSTSDFRLYYFDSNHLTITGASVLAPLFDQIFNNIHKVN